jgi:hypothetical protein
VVEFGEWLCEEVLKYVPHRQWVFSISKRLRIYFLFDRKLLTKLSRCTWKVLNLYLTQWIPPVRVYHPYPLKRFGVIT